MSNNNTAVAQQRPTSKAKQWLQREDFKAAISQVVPKHITPERYVRAAMTAMTRVPKLAECDETSFTKCLLQLAEYGLEPDGRRAHLIPRWNSKLGHMECTLIIDWKGLAELVMRSGMVSVLHADVVRRGDIFVYSKGELKDHVPWALRDPEDRPPTPGEIYCVYCLAKMKDGTEKCEVMTLGEVEDIRKRSQAGNNGPWVTDFNEMAKKTVFRRLSKWLPLSPEIRSAAENDDDVIVDIEPQNVRRIDGGSEGLATALEDMLAKSAEDNHPIGIEEQQPQVLDTTVVENREAVPVQAQQQTAKSPPKGKKADNPADALVQESLAATDTAQIDDIIRRAGTLETEQQRMKVYLACDAKKKELTKH